MVNDRETATRPVYVGPRPFLTGERLFGRDREVAALTSLLVAQRVVVVYAPSGAGKTSLIQAGLVPQLRPAPAAAGTAPRPDGRPLPFDVPAVGGSADPAAPAVVVRLHTPTDLPGANRYVLSALDSLETHRPPAGRRPTTELAGRSLRTYLAEEFPIGEAADPDEPFRPTVLIFDQFEEVLTQDPTDTTEKNAFFEQLGAVLEDRTRWVVIAVREDYLGALEPFLALLPTRLDARFRLDRLTPEAAEAAVRGPARDAGVEFEPDAAAGLVKQLCRMRVQQPDNSFVNKDGPYVEPVHLQVVCKCLWEIDRDPARITAADIGRLGGGARPADEADWVGVDRVLAGYYAAHVANAAAAGVGERRVREWFDRELISAAGSRKPAQRGEEDRYGLTPAALAVLGNAYLIREESRGGTRWWELAHDRLIAPVREDNVRWRLDHLHPVQRQADEWAAQGKPAGLLLKGAALAEAERWARGRADELTDGDRAYLDECRASRDRRAGRGVSLAEVGWGVVFAHDADPALREAISELLDHRRREAARERTDLYHEFTGPKGYRAGESVRQFCTRHGVGSGPPDWAAMPYYLLLVGDPTAIPFEFQYGLAERHAVGRVHFETAEEYARYARTVVTAEEDAFGLPPRAAFFGPLYPDDAATRLGHEILLGPLLDRLRTDQPAWAFPAVLGADATKARLGRFLGGPETPAFLFCIGHSIDFPAGDPEQTRRQGALLCQDWSGPPAKPTETEFSFSADDVTDDARPLGLIGFLFTSHSGGCPELDDFFQLEFADAPKRNTPHSFVAGLPQRLLGHPNGGALAVIGHVDRVWGYSFMTDGKPDIGAFITGLNRLLEGFTVGEAMQFFSQRHTRLASYLAKEMEQVIFFRARPDEYELASLRTETVDARNWIILGDPAVRLSVATGAGAPVRPADEPG